MALNCEEREKYDFWSLIIFSKQIMFLICSLLTYSTFFSQVEHQNNAIKKINEEYFLKVIQVEYDTTILDFGKAGKHLSLSPTKIKWGLYCVTNDSLIYSFNHLKLQEKSILISKSGDQIVLINNVVDYKEKFKNIKVVEFYLKSASVFVAKSQNVG